MNERDNHEEWVSCRGTWNKVTKSLRCDKKEYVEDYNSEIQNKTSPKKLWDMVKRKVIWSVDLTLTFLKNGRDLITNKKVIANSINNYYMKKINDLLDTIPSVGKSYIMAKREVLQKERKYRKS